MNRPSINLQRANLQVSYIRGFEASLKREALFQRDWIHMCTEFVRHVNKAVGKLPAS